MGEMPAHMKMVAALAGMAMVMMLMFAHASLAPT